MKRQDESEGNFCMIFKQKFGTAMVNDRPRGSRKVAVGKKKYLGEIFRPRESGEVRLGDAVVREKQGTDLLGGEAHGRDGESKIVFARKETGEFVVD